MQGYKDELYHWGIKGMKWGVRRYQNKNGTLTAAGKKHYSGDGNAGEDAEQVSMRRSARARKPRITPMRSCGAHQPAPDGKAVPRLTGADQHPVDDPNKELKAEKERLQLQKDVKQLRNDVYGGKSFVKQVMSDAGKQVLTKATAGVMSYGAKKFVSDVLGNPELANAVVNGSAAKQDQQKKDDQK